MRGIAELVEVSNAPPTISPVNVPAVTQLNGMGVGDTPPDAGQLADEDMSKTPEPPATTPPSSAPAQALPNRVTADEDRPPPPSSAAPAPIPVKPHPQPLPREPSGVDSPNTSANFARMRNRLAQQMGLSSEVDTSGDNASNGSNSDRGSTSPTPVVRRRPAKAPPPPKRGTSYRSSTEVPVATEQQALAVGGGGEATDGLNPAKKSFSVEDITAALDDMVDGDEYLQENSRLKNRGVVEAKATPAAPPATQGGGDGLDALTLALQGFPAKSAASPPVNPEETG